jgi:hypothetical protein
MHHLDETFANICMKHMKTLHMLATCMYMQHPDLFLQHPDKTLVTFVWTDKTFGTYNWNILYSSYSMCNIPIYFCNIPMKDLKHMKHTIATCAFSVASACCWDKWRLVDVELDAGAELDVAEWHGGLRCGARRWHGPQQGQGQANGARPRREARVWARARGASGRQRRVRGGAAEGEVRLGVEARNALSEQATRKASERLIRGPSERTDDL